MKSIADRIMAKAARPDGASRHELTSHLFMAPQRPEERKRLDELVDAGKLHRFTRQPYGGRGNPAQQFFADPAAGERWAAANPLPRDPKSKPRSTYKAIPLTVSDKQRRKGVVQATLESAAEAIVPPGLKPQVLDGMPAFDPRYQVDPKTRVIGGFASLGPGRYLEDTRP